MRRRDALGRVAATAAIAWLSGDERSCTDVRRVRAGGTVDLHCPGAETFVLDLEGSGRLVVPATGGAARVRLPFPEPEGDDVEWARLDCQPMSGGRPIAGVSAMLVLCAPIRFPG